MSGIIENVPESEYHADRSSLSQSGAKLILKAPAKFRWEQDHPVYKDVFDFGTAAHRVVLGVGPNLIVHEYDTEKVKSPKATKAWKEQQSEVRAVGDVLLLPDEMATVQAMADKLSEHRLAMELLSDGKPEVSAYAMDPDTEILMRGRFDWLGPEVITDYKSCASSEPVEFLRAAIRYGYDLQAGWYLDLAALCDCTATAFAHICQEKEPPYIVTVIILPPELIDRGRWLKRQALERYRDCTESGKWPGYLPDNDFATPAAPAWLLREMAEQDIA